MKVWDVTGGISIAVVQALRGEKEFQAPSPPATCPICGRGTTAHRHEEKQVVAGADVLPMRKGA